MQGRFNYFLCAVLTISATAHTQLAQKCVGDNCIQIKNTQGGVNIDAEVLQVQGGIPLDRYRADLETKEKEIRQYLLEKDRSKQEMNEYKTSYDCLEKAQQFAKYICGEIKRTGKKVKRESKKKIEGEIGGVIKKFVGGIEGEASTKSFHETYENVLQEDMAEDVLDTRACRQKMAKTVIETCKLSKQQQAQTRPLEKPEEVVDRRKKTPKTITGCWIWSNGEYVRIQKNQSAYLRNGTKGTWKEVDKEASLFEIQWPPLVDNLQKDKKRGSYSGKNWLGLPMTITKSRNRSQLEGIWKIKDAAFDLQLNRDRTAKALAFTGKWDVSNNLLTITWPLNDKIFLSQDGNSLRAQSQIGAFTAQRDASCGLL